MLPRNTARKSGGLSGVRRRQQPRHRPGHGPGALPDRVVLAVAGPVVEAIEVFAAEVRELRGKERAAVAGMA